MKSKTILLALFALIYFRPVSAQDVIRINLADKANAHLFGPEKELSNQIIEGVKAGIIRPFTDSELKNRMTYEDFISRVDPLGKKAAFNREEFNRVELTRYTGEEKWVYISLALIRSAKFTPSGKDEVIAYFLYEEITVNVTQDNPDCFSKEPSGREMYYHEMMDRGLFKAE